MLWRLLQLLLHPQELLCDCCFRGGFRCYYSLRLLLLRHNAPADAHMAFAAVAAPPVAATSPFFAASVVAATPWQMILWQLFLWLLLLSWPLLWWPLPWLPQPQRFNRYYFVVPEYWQRCNRYNFFAASASVTMKPIQFLKPQKL
jgi:hypothetical protein